MVLHHFVKKPVRPIVEASGLVTKAMHGVVPCGGPKKSPRTSSIVQIIFFF